MKKKLAIVSSYNELCGNATYTYALKKEFEKYFYVDVIPLDTYSLRSNSKNVRKIASKQIMYISEKVKDYDYVNIQFEFGLFGNNRSDVFDRFKKILSSANNVIITMHRIELSSTFFSFNFIKDFIRSPFASLRRYKSELYYAQLYRDIIHLIKKESFKKNVHIMVHTKRDKKNIELIFGFKNVHDHPITFLNDQELKYYKDKSIHANLEFRKKYSLSQSDVAIGIFGFISSYKGHDVAIKALCNLPNQYKLFIFGGIHPHSLKINQPIDDYLSALITLIEEEKKSNNLKERVFFCGPLDDEEFITALNYVDFTVLPYLETGQSGSGIAALTLETKTKSFFSKNLAFLELEKYAGKAFKFFDIGNHLELSQAILSYNEDFSEILDVYYRNYNITTNIKLHKDIFEGTFS